MLYLQHLAVYYVDTKRHVIPTVARKDAIYKCYQAAKNRGFHGLLFRTADGVHQVLQLTRHMINMDFRQMWSRRQRWTMG